MERICRDFNSLNRSLDVKFTTQELLISTLVPIIFIAFARAKWSAWEPDPFSWVCIAKVGEICLNASSCTTVRGQLAVAKIIP